MAMALSALLSFLPAAAALMARPDVEDEPLLEDFFSRPPSSSCQADMRYDNVCQMQPRWAAFTDPFSPLRRKRRSIRDVERLSRDFAAEMGRHHKLAFSFYESWMRIFNLQAVDVLATKETWTADDTRILRAIANGTMLVGRDGSKLDVTTENIVELLPRVRDLDRRVYNGSLAIVGNGADLENSGLGEEIDSHDQVARFNNLVEDRLNRTDTGLKQTIHVINALVDLPMFDLEFGWPCRAWCNRLMVGGNYVQRPFKELYMFRPTGYCRMPKHAMSFSRGFLFFWLYGSLWENLKLYGFSDSSGHQYDDQKKVHESYLRAEHALYRALAKQHAKLLPSQS